MIFHLWFYFYEFHFSKSSHGLTELFYTESNSIWFAWNFIDVFTISIITFNIRENLVWSESNKMLLASLVIFAVCMQRSVQESIPPSHRPDPDTSGPLFLLLLLLHHQRKGFVRANWENYSRALSSACRFKSFIRPCAVWRHRLIIIDTNK